MITILPKGISTEFNGNHGATEECEGVNKEIKRNTFQISFAFGTGCSEEQNYKVLFIHNDYNKVCIEKWTEAAILRLFGIDCFLQRLSTKFSLQHLLEG